MYIQQERVADLRVVFYREPVEMTIQRSSQLPIGCEILNIWTVLRQPLLCTIEQVRGSVHVDTGKSTMNAIHACELYVHPFIGRKGLEVAVEYGASPVLPLHFRPWTPFCSQRSGFK